MEDLLVEPTLLPQISPYKSQISYRAARAASSSDRTSREEAIANGNEVKDAAESKRYEGILNKTRPSPSLQSSTDAKTSSWGRMSVTSWLGAAGCGSIILLCPTLVIFIWIALEHHQGSIFSSIAALWQHGFFDFVEKFAPVSTWNATVGYLAWLSFQAILYRFLPGPLSTGQLTPAGHLLKYNTNGLLAWAVTHIFAVALVLLGLLDPALPAKHWPGLLVAANVCGFLLSKASYSK